MKKWHCCQIRRCADRAARWIPGRLCILMNLYRRQRQRNCGIHDGFATLRVLDQNTKIDLSRPGQRRFRKKRDVEWPAHRMKLQRASVSERVRDQTHKKQW